MTIAVAANNAKSAFIASLPTAARRRTVRAAENSRGSTFRWRTARAPRRRFAGRRDGLERTLFDPSPRGPSSRPDRRQRGYATTVVDRRGLPRAGRRTGGADRRSTPASGPNYPTRAGREG